MYEGAYALSTAPTDEPLDPSELRGHLLAEEGRDDAIASYATAARRQLEKWSGRSFMKQTWTLKLDRFPGDSSRSGAGAFDRRYRNVILLPRPPLQSVTSIVYTDANGDSQTVATTVYGIDTVSEPGRAYLKEGQSWPTDVIAEPLAVTITYVAGYSSSATIATQRAAVPEEVKQAIRLLAERYYDMDATEGHMATVEHLLSSFTVMEYA